MGTIINSSRMRASLSLVVVVGLGMVPLLAVADEPAEQSKGYVRVEETWELKVKLPDHEVGIPQMVISTSPGVNAKLTGVLNFNFRQLPGVDPELASQPGGLQVQIFNGGDQLLSEARLNDTKCLHHFEEEITWTQFVQVNGTNMTFGIKELASRTWGKVPAGKLLTRTPSELTSMDHYSTQASVEESGVLFGQNRIASLKLVGVRKYFEDGTFEDDDRVHTIIGE